MTLDDLLAELASRPRTLGHLAGLLHTSPGQVEAALQQLRRGGYVDKAIPDENSCHAGCGKCSMKNLCPSQGPLQLAETTQETWRLTDKALNRVRPPA